MPTPDLPKVEAAIVQLTNIFRREQGLAAVSPNIVLRKAAEDFARYLARTGTFSHTADGRQPGDRAKAAGYDFCIVSENLASNLDSRGFETQQLARDAVEGWKGSPGHRKNMVEPNVSEIAVAVAKAPGEEKFLSVQLFGRPISQRYDFTVSNASEWPVAYTFAGRSFTVEERRIITHTECVPGTLAFVSAGSWLTKQKLDAAFPISPGAGFLIEPAAGSSGVVVRAVKAEAAKAQAPVSDKKR
jgi:Cysteine-rich secretory protein family